MSDQVAEDVIHRTRFLVVDGDREVRDSIERYLLMEAAPKVFKAGAPLAALRILQDDKTEVDCVICANKRGTISGMEFLQNLRTGRWGGPKVSEVDFILMMDSVDESVVRIADTYNVTGYIFGEIERKSVTEAIAYALGKGESQSPFTKCPVAHIRLGGADVILVAFEKSFGEIPPNEQQEIIQDIHTATTEFRLAGQIVPVWEDDDRRTMFIAPTNYHAALRGLTLDTVWRSLNKEIPVKRNPHLRTQVTDRNSRKGGQADSSDGGAAGSMGSQEDTIALKAGGKPKGPLRALTHEDIGRVLLAFKHMGPAKFEESFVKSQTIVRRTPENDFVPLMREYFINLDKLRNEMFADVDLRTSGQMFNDLTLSLDQCIMRSVGKNKKIEEPFSVNLNVKTTATDTFKNFVEQVPKGYLTLEFRQPNVVEFFDEFMLAREIFETNRIQLALDHVLPDAIGLVNAELLQINKAKVYWNSDAHRMLLIHRDRVARLKEQNIEIVLVHVDDPSALAVGGELEIEHFQGFLLDDLMQK